MSIPSRHVLALTFLLAALSFGGVVVKEPYYADLDPANCPVSPNQLGPWRDRVGQLLFGRATPQRKDFRQLVDRCAEKFPKVFRSVEAQACLGNLLSFAAETGRSSDPKSQFGFKVSDADYRAGKVSDGKGGTKPMDYPMMVQEPPEMFVPFPDPQDPQKTTTLIDLMSDPARYADVAARVEVINAKRPEKKKWKVANYQSQHLNSPDELNTYGRILIYAPDAGANPDDPKSPSRFDQFIQVGFPTPEEFEKAKPGKPVRGQNFSIVSLQKLQAGATRDDQLQKPPKITTVDRWRNYDPVTGAVLKPLGDRKGSDNCYNCHKTGVLPFSPRLDGINGQDPKTLGTLEELNKKIMSYDTVQGGPPDWSDVLDTNAYGPGMGDATNNPPDPSDGFMKRCVVGGVKPADYAKVRDYMSCTMCHDGVAQGKLNYPLSLSLDYSPLVQTWVSGGAGQNFLDSAQSAGKGPPAVKRNHPRMPPDAPNDLPWNIRDSIANCVRDQYYSGMAGLDPPVPSEPPGIFKTWLLGTACPKGVGQIFCKPSEAPANASSGLIPKAVEKAAADAAMLARIMKITAGWVPADEKGHCPKDYEYADAGSLGEIPIDTAGSDSGGAGGAQGGTKK